MGPGDRVSAMIFFILTALFLLFEIRVAIGLFVKKPGLHGGNWLQKKWVRIAAAIAAILALTAAIDAFFIEPDWVVRENLTVTSPRVKKAVRIVHISDLHTEGFGKRHEKALRIVGEAKPDIIILTGDYLNGSRMKYLPELQKFVSRLEAPLGIYAVEGNFEYGQCPFEMFENVGIKVLEDEHVSFEEYGITLCGLSCNWNLQEAQRRILQEAATGRPEDYLVVLCHYPNHIEEPEMVNTDLYLCGHTHGGQVRLPLWGAIVTLSKTGKKYECGSYEHGRTRIYVNRGLGMEGGSVPRTRFLCRPEVTVIDILPQDL